jgi:phosphatidylglycerophosphate synthase
VRPANIPNIITSARLIAAAVLLWQIFASPDRGTAHFLLLFIIAGVSDMLDGFIARRFNWCTEFGARLDSVSDLALYTAVMIFLYINCPAELGKCSPIVAVGALVQCFHCVLSFVKLGQYPAYHTTFSRVCAYAIFFGVIAFWQSHLTGILSFLFVAWIASTCEGIIITLVLKKPSSNLAGISAALAVK